MSVMVVRLRVKFRVRVKVTGKGYGEGEVRGSEGACIGVCKRELVEG